MMVRAVGSELLVIGLMFIAVKWNRKNGIMSGFGCLCATVSIFFHTLSQDQGEFVFLRHAYIIAAMMFLGGMHVQFFPSNIYKKTGKSNHGNTSDIVAILCIVLYPHADRTTARAEIISKYHVTTLYKENGCGVYCCVVEYRCCCGSFYLLL